MELEDWRNVSASTVAGLYAAERDRWAASLHWDNDGAWSVVEEARRNGELPGFLALGPHGDVLGWTYFLVRNRILQIGALTGHRAETVRTLLDAVLSAPEAALARRYQCFVYPETGAVEAALQRRRFRTDRYLYLLRPLTPTSHGSTSGLPAQAWDERAFPAAVRLVARAYAGMPSSRCFAPWGRLDEWTTYLAQLLRTAACGTYAPAESFLIGDPEAPQALILATRLDAQTTHVAQVVVDPSARGAGLGAALVNASARAALTRGAARQTLLVAASNAAARSLYARLGFVEQAWFVFGERDRVTRSGRRASAGLQPDSVPAQKESAEGELTRKSVLT